MPETQKCKELDVDDVLLLMLFYNDKKMSSMSAYITSDIENITTTNMSYQTIYRRLVNLVKHGLLNKGLSIRKKKSFYLTEKGIEYLNGLEIKCNINEKEAIDVK